MFTYIAWRFLILSTFLLGALCCRCAREHPQKQFCQSEFVLKVEIYKEHKGANDQVFTMEIKKVFKGSLRRLSLIEARYVFVVISRNCRYDFKKSVKEYIIFGHSFYGMVRAYPKICNGIYQWSAISGIVPRALNAESYRNNCDCAHKISYDDNYDPVLKECEWSESYMKRKGGICKWDKNRSYEKCVYFLRLSPAWN